MSGLCACLKKTGDQNIHLVTLCCYQAELYRGLGDFPRSEKIHWRALKIRQTVLEELATSRYRSDLSNLALLFHIQCKYDQAEPLYKTLLDIEQKDWETRHMHVAEDSH